MEYFSYFLGGDVTQTNGNQLYQTYQSQVTTVTTSSVVVTYLTMNGYHHYPYDQVIRGPVLGTLGCYQTPEQLQAAETARVEANNRAEELMFMVIGEHRKKSYIEKQHFDVEVNGKTYRIHRGRSMNVALLDPEGKAKELYCAHPVEYVPDPDTMLSQFLMLKTNEQEFLKLANRRAA